MSTAELLNVVGTETEAAEAQGNEILEFDTSSVADEANDQETVEEPADDAQDEKPKKQTLAQQKAALLEETFIQRSRVRDAEGQVAADAETLKGSKEILKRRQASLGELLDRLESVCHGQLELQLLPATDGDDQANETAVQNETAEDIHGLAAISVLKIPAGMLEKLEGADIERIVDLEKAMAGGLIVPGQIKGLGQSAIDKITDALVAYRGECPVPVVEG